MRACMRAAGEGGLQAVMGLLHLFLEAPRWEAGAMERAKQMYASHWRSLGKGLERATADRVMAAMLGPDRRARVNPPSCHLLFSFFRWSLFLHGCLPRRRCWRCIAWREGRHTGFSVGKVRWTVALWRAHRMHLWCGTVSLQYAGVQGLAVGTGTF